LNREEWLVTLENGDSSDIDSFRQADRLQDVDNLHIDIIFVAILVIAVIVAFAEITSRILVGERR